MITLNNEGLLIPALGTFSSFNDTFIEWCSEWTDIEIWTYLWNYRAKVRDEIHIVGLDNDDEILWLLRWGASDIVIDPRLKPYRSAHKVKLEAPYYGHLFFTY